MNAPRGDQRGWFNGLKNRRFGQPAIVGRVAPASMGVAALFQTTSCHARELTSLDLFM
ncbi:MULTISPECIES: hypothetical protein [unclassified Streptomyces]|uniref:hypothetical protein n=1 Tax=unclassified Streptomyces TaxID=2593676 RepID=UPI003651538C